VSQLDQALRGPEFGGQRLLAENVLTRRQGLPGYPHVGERRRGDVHQVDVRPFEHLLDGTGI